ncbi:hypothetical protein [Chitinophaga sp. Cy-1792]|uniref:hypothetical protein n=1 Tax=Chitinophaga sp. Cy-1792 TaxID=2608339 RepID=UPI001420131C|nr:hypothetical protein [Chitinophaga sp. Cy-1792]NIG56112.1 hypothetical protein [Chitinophaga sp. Cy-1792]
MSEEKRPNISEFGGFISKDEMDRLLGNYSDDHGDQKSPDFVKAMCFSKDKVLELLAQNNAAGLRIYYGLHLTDDNQREKKMVLVATDADGCDILPTGVTSGDLMGSKGGSGLILDQGVPCPQFCSPDPSKPNNP